MGHGFARAVRVRVLAAWVAALGRQGPKGGRRACKSADIAAKRPIRTRDPARTWDRAWHTSDIIFRARNGAKGGSNGRTRTSEGEDGGQVEVLCRAEVLELGHCLVSLRADGVLQSRAKRFSTRDPAARGGMVSWGRGVVDGLAKVNARSLARPRWAEAGTPAMKSADLRGELGGRRATICRRRTRGIASKRKQQHGQVESRRPVRANRR